MLKTNLPPEKVVIMWDNIYQTGKRFFIPIANTSYLLFALAAYTNWSSDLRTPLGDILGIDLTEGVQLALAGGCLFSTLPFVLAFMLPYSVKRMKKRVEMVKVAGINQTEVILDERGLYDDVDSWMTMNSVRTGIFLSAFMLGLTAL